MNAGIEKPARIQIALSTIVPFIVGLFATRLTLVIGEQYGTDTLPVVLVAWCVVLIIAAWWLNRVAFRSTKMLSPFLITVLAILTVWLWQRLAFKMLVPHSNLTYGYFLTPEGTKARFWVLTCPFWIGSVCLVSSFVTALVLAWRAGFRGLLTCMIPWWITAFLIFALPSVYLDGQGNATIFI
jgi:hypothetical protein